MEETTRRRIESYLDTHDGIIRTVDFQRAGLHNSYISTLKHEGRIVRIKPGLYISADAQTASGFFEAQRALPSAVICLGSALAYYELSTYEPPVIHVALPRGNRTRGPEFPPVRRFSFGGPRYGLGVVTDTIDGRSFTIYDREKTMCDVIRFRRTLGQDVVNESLRTYLSGAAVNVDLLLQYARVLREEGPVLTHLRLST